MSISAVDFLDAQAGWAVLVDLPGFTAGAPGLDMYDLIFDTQTTGLGADLAAGFKVEQLISSNPNARSSSA